MLFEQEVGKATGSMVLVDTSKVETLILDGSVEDKVDPLKEERVEARGVFGVNGDPNVRVVDTDGEVNTPPTIAPSV